MNAAPTVSVIVTCYNLGQYLDEAVDSVLAQTYQDFEIVIVNDGSTDPDTNALLATYDRPRTRIVAIENRGLPGARNEGIRQTTGRYVCTLDADDLLEKTYFEKAVAVLDTDPSIAFVSHWLRTFGDEEREWTPTSADFPALLDMNSINGAALVRRTALTAVGGYDESMRHGCEDWDLWISMVERGLRGTILPEILFFYRRRTDSMSRVMMEGRTHVDLYRYLIEKHRPSFAAHAADLLLRREDDWAGLLRESHDLDLDCTATLEPERDRLRETVRVSRRKLDRLRAQAVQEAELTHRQTVMNDMDAELTRHGPLLSQMDAELTRRGQLLTEMDAELKQRDQLLTAMDAELKQRDQLLTAMDAELKQRNQLLTAMDAELKQRNQLLTEMDVELARRGQLLTEMQTELARREQLLGEMDAELAYRSRLLAEKDGVLGQQAHSLTAMEAELVHRQQTITDQAEELERRAVAFSERSAQLTALNDELRRDREGIVGLHREIQMLRGSLSWRLTRPLRSVYSRLFERK